jgi:hypothetical protein
MCGAANPALLDGFAGFQRRNQPTRLPAAARPGLSPIARISVGGGQLSGGLLALPANARSDLELSKPNPVPLDDDAQLLDTFRQPEPFGFRLKGFDLPLDLFQ